MSRFPHPTEAASRCRRHRTDVRQQIAGRRGRIPTAGSENGRRHPGRTSFFGRTSRFRTVRGRIIARFFLTSSTLGHAAAADRGSIRRCALRILRLGKMQISFAFALGLCVLWLRRRYSASAKCKFHLLLRSDYAYFGYAVDTPPRQNANFICFCARIMRTLATP